MDIDRKKLEMAKHNIEIMSIPEEAKKVIIDMIERGDVVVYNHDDEYDYCYETGNYSDQICEICPHRFECSGYEDDD